MSVVQRAKLTGRRRSPETRSRISARRTEMYRAKRLAVWLKPYFLDIFLALVKEESVVRPARRAVALAEWKVSTAARNRQQKILNDALDGEQREELRSKYKAAAKAGWSTLRSRVTPKQLTEQRRFAAVVSHARARNTSPELRARQEIMRLKKEIADIRGRQAIKETA